MLVVRAASCVTSALAPVLVLDVFRLDVRSGVPAILVPGENLLGFFPQFTTVGKSSVLYTAFSVAFSHHATTDSNFSNVWKVVFTVLTEVNSGIRSSADCWTMVSYSVARVGDRARSPVWWTVVSYTLGRVADGPRSPHWTVVSVTLARIGDGPRSPVW